MTMGTWIYESDERLIKLSPELMSILDLPIRSPDLTPDELVKFIHKEDREKVRQSFRSPSPNQIVTVEYRGYRRGEIRFYRAIGKIECDPEGKPLRVLGATQDITDIKNAEAQVLEREKQLRFTNAILLATIEATADGLLLIDENGKVILANRKFYELWHIPEELRKGKNDEVLIRTVAEQLVEPERFLERIRKIYLDPTNDYFDTLFFKDGRVFERYSRPQKLDGKTAARVWSFRDVTESRKNFAEMMNAIAKAEHASKVKSEFLANVSHEIRTPMTAILGYIEVILENEQLRNDPQVSSPLETIRRNGEHLLGIINDILDLSKIEAGKLDVNHSTFELIPALTDLIDLFQVRARAKNIDLSLHAESLLPKTIQSDLLRIRQILINLVGNAIKFTESGFVNVSVHYDHAYSHGGNLSIQVKDTGIGIKPDELQNLFKPFVQSDMSTSRKFGGTGLGLTISRHFAQMLNGSIEVHSEYGKGSEFTLHIPIRYSEPPELVDFRSDSKQPILFTPNPEPNALSLAGIRLLLAEDGQDNRVLISHLLEKAGASVVLATNGLEAIREINASETSSPIDLVLMDMQMPEMDGYTATRELRKHGYAGPIIALTAHSMSGDREKCLNAGCDDYASKPINRIELLKLCLRLLKKPT